MIFSGFSAFLLIDGPPFLLPRLKSTQQCCRVLNPFCFECDHRTGGRMFLRSRTVRHDHLVARQLVNVFVKLLRRNEVRAGNVPHVP